MLGYQAPRCDLPGTGWPFIASALQGTWVQKLSSQLAQLKSSASPSAGGDAHVRALLCPLIPLTYKESLLALGAKNYL